MFRLCHYFKIFRTVIEPVLVLVMHDFARSKRSTEHFFSDDTMLVPPAAFHVTDTLTAKPEDVSTFICGCF